MVCLAHLRHAAASNSASIQPIQPLNFMGMVSSDFYEQYYPQQGLSPHIRAVTPWEPRGSAQYSGNSAQHDAASEAGSSHSVEPKSGTVIVLVGPNGERSFLSDPHFGMQDFCVTQEMVEKVAGSQWLFIEGYMLEHVEVVDKLHTLLEVAQHHGVSVALSAGDVSIVHKAAPQFWRILSMRRSDKQPVVDLLFGNASEARALVQSAPPPLAHLLSPTAVDSPVSALASDLARFAGTVAITDGPRGSYISQCTL